MQSVTQIKVGKHKTGLVGFEKILKDVADIGALSEHDIACEMIERLSKKNDIPSGAYEQ